MLSQLENNAKVVGAKQTRRAVKEGKVSCIFLARDADPVITAPMETMGQEHQIKVEWVATMKDLGQACGISVGASVAALLLF